MRSGEHTIEGYHYIWSGPNDGRGLYGVALALPAHLRASIVSWRPISARLLTARLHHRHGKLTVIVVYGPTDIAAERSKDAYQEQLTHLIQSAPPHDVTLVLTDANASLAPDAHDGTSPAIMGPVFVDTTTNDNGHRLVNVCRATNLCIADTWFPRRRIHHWSCYSNYGTTRKAIDHVLISAKWRSAITKFRVYRGAQLGNTDHRMLAADLRLRLMFQRAVHHQPRLDMAAPKNDDTQRAYSILLYLQYTLPEQLSDWPTFKTSVTAAAQNALGRSRPAAKQPWISSTTLNIVNRRREARLRGDRALYRQLNGARNASIRRDQETFWERKATQLEEASQRNDLRQMYGTLKSAKAEPNHRSFLVKDHRGNILATERECIGRWKEHFSQLLNHQLQMIQISPQTLTTTSLSILTARRPP